MYISKLAWSMEYIVHMYDMYVCIYVHTYEVI